MAQARPSRIWAVGLGVLLLSLLVGSSALLASRGSADPAAQVGRATVTRPISIRESGYRLLLTAPTAELTVENRTGRTLTQFPLLAVAGRANLPRGVLLSGRRTGTGLVVTAETSRHQLLVQATLTTAASYFTVSFETALGPDPGLGPRFFTDGATGLGTGAILQAVSPDPQGGTLGGPPITRVGRRNSISPPPFDLLLRTASGWLGVGLVQVPDATQLSLSPNDAVTLNYPLATLASITDTGAGGRVGWSGGSPLLRFPTFVVTFASGPWTGLTAYHSALQRMGFAPQAVPPGHWPEWWMRPLVDTWGDQVEGGAWRTSPLFTTAWVRNYVTAWESKYGQRQITLVIDSQWQARIGEAVPSARFGGVAGLRRLIASFHAQGIHVLLWWPLWSLGSKCVGLSGRAGRMCATPPDQRTDAGIGMIDPTAPSFGPQLLSEMRLILGHGPGQLGADGLKIDWGQLTPDPLKVQLARPQLGVGAAALLRYLQMIYTDAQRVQKGALVESSAVAPQFGGTLSMLRLYDAKGEASWQIRARIISAVDPGTLIDGDQWPVRASQAVAHAVTSTVYGTPASYFLDSWYDKVPITQAEARVLGAIMRLAPLKGEGAARALPNGGWQYWVGNQLRAETLAGNTALAVYSASSCGRARTATVVSAVRQWVSVPELKTSRRALVAAGVPLVVQFARDTCAPALPGFTTAGQRVRGGLATPTAGDRGSVRSGLRP
ncbi:MAG TPA: hypothetical protein VNH82_07770 [Candidatus Dormibacteraeota bacterium]|nr:hypothetical protein [Candidatus Dormibacteraeota bacterium]